MCDVLKKALKRLKKTPRNQKTSVTPCQMIEQESSSTFRFYYVTRQLIFKNQHIKKMNRIDAVYDRRTHRRTNRSRGWGDRGGGGGEGL